MGAAEPPDDRWRAVWAHRERLLRIARARVADPVEAEDVVSEAVLRCVCRGYADVVNLEAWLTTVTVNLCHETYRERARAERWYSAAVPSVLTDFDDVLCDWACVATTLHRLPARQRTAIALRAVGWDVPDIATRLDCTYKTAESLLSRGRVALRASLAEEV